jgi:hypothetical protein
VASDLRAFNAAGRGGDRLPVIPAQAGIHLAAVTFSLQRPKRDWSIVQAQWIPACAGMTGDGEIVIKKPLKVSINLYCAGFMQIHKRNEKQLVSVLRQSPRLLQSWSFFMDA